MGPLACFTPKEQANEEHREFLVSIAEIAAGLDAVRAYMDRQLPDVRAALITSREWQTIVSLALY